MKLAVTALPIFFAVSLAFADDLNARIAPSHYIMGFFGESELIFGSEDGRFGGGISYASGNPEKRFTLWGLPAQIVYEGYVDHTQSDGGGGFPANSTFAVGTLAYARWRWPMDHEGNGVYADFGWGMQLANHPTLDLGSDLNSTPVAGFGGVYRVGDREYLIGLRLLHISNAGLVPPNFGQNELFITFGVRY